MKREDQIAKILNEAYIELVNKRQQRVSLDDFADWLTEKSGKRISIVNLSRWMNAKHPPAGDNAHALAAVFGTRIYEILGMEKFIPPSMALQQIEKRWHKIPPEDRQQIMQIVEKAKRGDETQMVLEPVT